MDFIKKYWEEQGKMYGDSHMVSWGDHHMINLEIETISKHINYSNSVLDVGCANGFSTIRQSDRHPSCEFTGIDYAENLIEIAQKSALGIDSLKFKVGDARNIPFYDETFDVVYTTRVLINLPSWEEQKTAIKECIRVCKSGGKIILSEAFWEPLQLLNSIRQLKNLKPLVMHDFNRYLNFSTLHPFLEEIDNIVVYETEDFSSIYYLGSRFLRELVTDADKYVEFSNPINKIFYNIERDFSGGGFGIQQAVIMRKGKA